MQRLGEVIVHLVANTLNGGFQVGVTGQNKCASVGLHAAHGADHGKTVTRLANVQIGKQNVELASANEFQSLGNTANGSDRKPVMGKCGSQGRS